MGTFAAMSTPHFLFSESCNCGKQNQQICHSDSRRVFFSLFSSLNLLGDIFCIFISAFSNSYSVMILLVVFAETFRIVHLF